MRRYSEPTTLCLLLLILLATVPLTSCKPFDKPGTKGVLETSTNWWIYNFNQRVWAKQIVKHDSPDNQIHPVKKPNQKNQVNWCDFRAMWRPEQSLPMAKGSTEKAEHCYEIPNVTGKNAESPCHNLGMDNSAMMGMWGSPDIQCELFFDDWCKKTVRVANGSIPNWTKYDKIELPSSPLSAPGFTWGHDNMDAGKADWRSPPFGFQKLGFEGFGPKSIRCWFPDKAVQVGLSNNAWSNAEQGKPLRKRHTGEELPPESEEEVSSRFEAIFAENASEVASAMEEE